MHKTIAIGSKELQIESISEYSFYLLAGFIQAVQADEKVLFNLAAVSIFVEIVVEVLIDNFPAELYKKKGDRYYWIGSFDQLKDLLNGLYFAYWEFELEAAKEAGNTEKIEAATTQLAFRV